ncbi:hypothetical protein BDA96_01G530800 [Sorghum bicolor]|jgi:hypothetical protein|uniref:SHSP domain-containing protein n=2 Tax=Sorghum bicolor TaxID=4558 RepID=A0A921S7D9_SORBI|nr:uncharacterized protein LOC8059857 [Sorghum bicolor]EER92826.1 hypothetical protein SORBI_3001G497500 [Sorghum bicolor]KAG0552709.1 hypothetical protein BDA96_01G530800 [Sorghum bicolor]|eukprot:XP_002465828.1 uncharacterized protein LOC8059857 [Sorghum bicolor]
MRIHPASPTVVGGGGGKKDLRRLPHVYSKVLELPLPADTDVEVFEGPDAFHFVAAPPAGGGARGAGVVRVRTVRIHPGVTKVVVQAGDAAEGVADDDDAGDSMELDRWRSRLPEPSCPAMAVAGYVDGQLVVTVPKGPGGGEGGDGGQGEVTWRCSGGGKISGRLVLVQ